MLHIHTSNHLEQLKDQFSEVIKTPLKDVLKTEQVVVQNAGMARWLSIEMAKYSGISANTKHLFPAEYMWGLLRLVSPDIPEHSQCAPDTLRFHIYQELINNPDDYAELHHYIYNSEQVLNPLNTWELSCQTARLLDQYLFYRSEWISDWEAQSASKKAEHWQARIWNKCVKDKGLLHWLSLQKQFTKDIEALDTSLLQERVCFFSMSALSPGYIDLLKEIGQKTDIHIFIINPCGDVYWGDIQSPKTFSKLDKTTQNYSEIGNPLLASLGKQGRDFINKLIEISDQDFSDDNNRASSTNEAKHNTQLAQIQDDIYHLREPEFIDSLNKNDNSIQFHSCHTAMREVEVLHDQILAELDADKNLAPSDIVVMMPDIEKYAPYIESVFSTPIAENSKQSLPFSIADRDPQNILKLVQAINKIWRLPETRFDVETVFELLEYEDISTHFGLNKDQIDYCRELALATNIRWGISAKTRQQNDLPNTEEHTWKYALDRMLLGYAIADCGDTADNELFHSKRNLQLLPYKEIEGNKALILAKLKQFTDLVFKINDWINQTNSLEDWLLKTKQLLQQLSPANSDQERVFKSLDDIQVKAKLAEFSENLSFDVFHKMLQQSLNDISANEKYLGYGITFCALVPMRSVPFKIVVLMGMNDGEYPRQDSPPSFDLMAKETRRGDRSRRDEDRYLFLESILAARQKLIISFIGQSIKDNTELAPSILISELLDTININSGRSAADCIVNHPLQAFSHRYYQTNNKDTKNLFSYVSHYLQLKEDDNCLVTDTPVTQEFITKPLEALGDEDKQLNLEELISFFKNPSRAFLKRRFEIQTFDFEKQLNIREPFEIESFKDREIRNQLLYSNADIADNNVDVDNTILRAKGLLPYGEIGNSILAKEKHTIDVFKNSIPELNQLDNIPFSIDIGSFKLHSVLDQLNDEGRCITQVSKPYAGDYIELWVVHLFMNAYINKGNVKNIESITKFYSPETSFQLNAVDNAYEQLETLLDYYWNGLCFPLQFFPKTSFALHAKGEKLDLTGMNAKWNGNQYAGEKDSFEHWLLHRNIDLDQEQQPEQFIQVSDDFFKQMFLSLNEL